MHNISLNLFTRFKQFKILIGIFCLLACMPPLLSFAQESSTKNYRFGVLTLTHPIVLYRQYIPFFDYLNEHLPWSFELVLYKGYAEVLKAIEDGELDMALLGGHTFMQVQRYTTLQPIVAVRSRDNTTKTYSIFVTKSDNAAINTIEDLRGKSIAFGSEQSSSSYLMPLYFLERNSISLKDFSNYYNLANHEAVARAVLRGEYDAGVMGESFARRFLGMGLKKIATTEPFPGFLLVARAGVALNVVDDLKNFLLSTNFNNEKVAEQAKTWPEILQHGFAPVVIIDYDFFNNLPKRRSMLHK